MCKRPGNPTPPIRWTNSTWLTRSHQNLATVGTNATTRSPQVPIRSGAYRGHTGISVLLYPALLLILKTSPASGNALLSLTGAGASSRGPSLRRYFGQTRPCGSTRTRIMPLSERMTPRSPHKHGFDTGATATVAEFDTRPVRPHGTCSRKT